MGPTPLVPWSGTAMEGGVGPSDGTALHGCAIARRGAVVDESNHESYLNVNNPKWLMEEMDAARRAPRGDESLNMPDAGGC